MLVDNVYIYVVCVCVRACVRVCLSVCSSYSYYIVLVNVFFYAVPTVAMGGARTKEVNLTINRPPCYQTELVSTNVPYIVMLPIFWLFYCT